MITDQQISTLIIDQSWDLSLPSWLCKFFFQSCIFFQKTMRYAISSSVKIDAVLMCKISGIENLCQLCIFAKYNGFMLFYCLRKESRFTRFWCVKFMAFNIWLCNFFLTNFMSERDITFCDTNATLQCIAWVI